MTIHYLAARHAFRQGSAAGCSVRGTQQVTTDSDEATCRECRHFADHEEGLYLTQQGQEYVNQLEELRSNATIEGKFNQQRYSQLVKSL